MPGTLSAGSSHSGGLLMWRSPCASAISMHGHKDCASCDCVGAADSGEEGERLEPGGLSAEWRPAGGPRGRRRCLSLLAEDSSSLSGLGGCRLQSFLGLLLTQAGAGFPLRGCLPGLKAALESCLFSP